MHDANDSPGKRYDEVANCIFQSKINLNPGGYIPYSLVHVTLLKYSLLFRYT